ncbi:GNAT family N-acetyltransferase [Parasphingorhabdus pacifica]
MNEIVFTRADKSLGEFAVRHVDPHADAELLYRWLTHPKSVFWLLNGADFDEVKQEFLDIDAADSHEAFLGLHDGRPAFLIERYDPVHSELNEVFELEHGDIGMHFLVAPTEEPLHGFTHAVLVTVMDLLFSDPSANRVVVEPDVRNPGVHALNAAVGFEGRKTVWLSGMSKDAYLSTCTREQYRAARSNTATANEGASR